MSEIGTITQLFRYPVKSMAGVSIDEARLGWHGIEGDRRYAFRRTATRNGFPFLTAGRLPELIRYQPFGRLAADSVLPTHVRTPEGLELEVDSAELRDALSERHGEAVELMRLDHGIFDEAPVSVICGATIRQIEREAGRPLDIRRFRPNVFVELSGFAAGEAGASGNPREPGPEPFPEDAWVGKTLILGDRPDSPAVTVTLRDLRCVMLNIDPDSAEMDARVMKTTARLNGNYAGVYGTVVREGRLLVGQKVYLKD